MKKSMLLALSMVLFIVVGLTAGWALDTHMPFAIVVASIGIIAFFGLYDLNLPDEPTGGDKESALRFAIAGSIVIEYLIIVALTAFFRDGLEKMPMITQTILTNFTAIVGVVVASYFGTSAYVIAKKPKAEKETESE